MAARSLPTFENAGDLFGGDIGFRQTGYVVGVGSQNVDALRASVANQRAVGVDTIEVDHAFVRPLWPDANLDDFATFAYEARGGYGDAYLTAQAFCASARARGVTLRQSTTVTRLLTRDGRVAGVELTDGTSVFADTVVLAAGPWSVDLLAPLGIDLPVTAHRESIVIVDPGKDLDVVPVFSDLVSLQYVRAEAGGKILFGNSDLAVLEPADPDNYRNAADDAFLEVTAMKMGHRFPGLPDASVASTYAGCYDVTPDFNPVISLAPVAGLVIAAGFSGHGFKISPAIGELIADLVIGGRSRDPLVPDHDFRLDRFAEGDLLLSPTPYVGAGEMR